MVLLDLFDCLKVVFLCSRLSLFTEEEIQAIRNTTYYDVLLRATSAESGDLQKNVFFWQNGTINLKPTRHLLLLLLCVFRCFKH